MPLFEVASARRDYGHVQAALDSLRQNDWSAESPDGLVPGAMPLQPSWGCLEYAINVANGWNVLSRCGCVGKEVYEGFRRGGVECWAKHYSSYGERYHRRYQDTGDALSYLEVRFVVR